MQQIIKEAEGMTWEELAQKAIEESKGKTFYGVGNSSRGKSALPLFIEALRSRQRYPRSWQGTGSVRVSAFSYLCPPFLFVVQI